MVATGLSPELAAIADFLSACAPFDCLTEAQLEQCVRNIEISYHREGSRINPDTGGSLLRIVKSGALDVLDGDNLLDRLGERESVNLPNLQQQNPRVFARVIEDTLLYQLDNTLLNELRADNRDFDRYYHSQRARRLRRAARYLPGVSKMMTPLNDLSRRDVVAASASTSVAEAAGIMTEQRVSSILIMDGDQLSGVVTDRDLRSRVVARQLSYATPLAEVMSRSPLTIDAGATLFDALLLMSQHNIHHLPLVEGHTPVGVVTASDIVRNREADPVYLIQRIAHQRSVAELAQVAVELPAVLKALVPQGAQAHQVTRIVSTVADHIGLRLLALAEQSLGAPPVPYCWLLFGSQARHEMILGGDQDNAMVIDDAATEQDLEYFARLADFVCDGLDQCGFDYCRGGIMAKNPDWRLPLTSWRQTVSNWVREPTEDAVMRVSIFFDIRGLHGQFGLAQALQQHMLASASANSIFMAMLARNAVSNTPPLGIFRRFVLETDGEHKNSLDLKHRGIVPIVDLARVEALRYQVSDVNTRARLQSLMHNGKLAIKDGRNLIDAAQFLQEVRLDSQYRQLSSGQAPDNYVMPADLSDIDSKHLKDVFSVIRDAQTAIVNRYTHGVV